MPTIYNSLCVKNTHVLNQGVESFYFIYERQNYDEISNNYFKFYIFVH